MSHFLQGSGGGRVRRRKTAGEDPQNWHPHKEPMTMHVGKVALNLCCILPSLEAAMLARRRAMEEGEEEEEEKAAHPKYPKIIQTQGCVGASHWLLIGFLMFFAFLCDCHIRFF